jgi:DNA-binding CsgD family transcriptional regulator
MSHAEAIYADTQAFRADAGRRIMSRDYLMARLGKVGVGEELKLSTTLKLLSDYCGAAYYLLARYDLVSEQHLDSVVSSDWPFDLVRQIETELTASYHKTNELEKSLSILQPGFALLPSEIVVPDGVNRQYSSVVFNTGKSRYILLFLLPEHVVPSSQRIMEAGLIAAYALSLRIGPEILSDRSMELTDRELECIYWIAEGKTSDEIAVILGISRNTINNYITSVMRKTATRNRSEAIAFAVRNNLV